MSFLFRPILINSYFKKLGDLRKDWEDLICCPPKVFWANMYLGKEIMCFVWQNN